jgi:hypothetical protein
MVMKMSLFMIDVVADGPYPPDYSMVSFAVIKLQADLSTAPRFFAEVAPISEHYREQTLQFLGITRAQHQVYEAPSVVMPRLVTFLTTHSKGRPVAMSDNPAFDFAFFNLYLHRYTGDNPFGFSARRIGDFYAGVRRDVRQTNGWKKRRLTTHDHNPLHDALGNAEAFLAILRDHAIKFTLD